MSPGDLLRPSPDRLWVLDRLGAVHFFFGSEDGFDFDRRAVTIPTAPRGGCVAGEEILLHLPIESGQHEDVVLHLVSDSAESVRAFANPYRHSHAYVTNRMRAGVVGCDDAGVAVLALSGLGRVAAYRIEDGELLWATELDGVQPARVEEREPGPTFVMGGSEGQEVIDEALRVIPTPDGHVIVQWKRVALADLMTERGDNYSVISWVLDLGSGSGIFLGGTLPEILDWQGDRVLVRTEDLAPRVRVLEVQLVDPASPS